MWIILLAMALLIAAALYQGLDTGRYTLASPKLSPAVSLKLCLITDLHSVWWGEGQQLLLERIRAMAPDAILLGGDIFDDKRYDSAPPVEALLRGIQGMAPCFYVTGSHDIWTWRMACYEGLLKDCGVTVLHGETVPLTLKGETIWVSGLDEPAAAVLAGRMDDIAFYRESLSAFHGLDRSRFNLLIAHRPEFIADYAHLGFDLTVSGHCHGGQVRLPFMLNGLFAPGQGWFPPYAAGQYQLGDTTLIVSRGLYFSYHLPRIFNRPEVVEITLTGASQ